MTSAQYKDPIFNVLAAHIAADAEAVRVCTAPHYLGATKISEIDAYENGPLSQASETLWNATEAVCDTVPTTISGCHALALFILDEESEDLSEHQIRALRSLSLALGLLGGR